MDKKDIAYVISALAIILVIAIVIKPLATGEPINTGIALTRPSPSITVIPHVVYANITSIIPTTPPTLVQTTPPTPTPTWNQKVQTIGFVNPAAYQVSLNQSIPSMTNISATVPNTSMTIYATISGKYSGTTQVISIPFPSWDLQYTIDPMAGLTGGTTPNVGPQYTPTYGSSYSHSGIQGSYSSIIPVFSIQVMDAGDPNRIVRFITPPGGIDPDLWKGIAPTLPAVTVQTTRKYGAVSPTPTPINTDPRPWTEKFFEGQRSYYFIINSQYINSYTIWIRVPMRYIGQY
jgi:hypothetical protein